MDILKMTRLLATALLTACLVACGGGGGGGGGDNSGSGGSTTPPPPPPPEPEPVTEMQASRFLSQATFGPTPSGIDALVASSLEEWFLAELDKPASLHLEDVLSYYPEDGNFRDENNNPLQEVVFRASDSFWEKAVAGDDQLRQRMAFALSQILVISRQSTLGQFSQTIAAYMDILTRGAFGNFRDLLEEVTYSPAMSVYLTYLRNEKADPVTGRVPDENYAREVLQLFTIGLVELNADGTAVLDGQGNPVELYDNDDITGLAKVFTGLSLTGINFNTPLRFIPFEAYYEQLTMFDDFHSLEEKSFLGATIPAGTTGEESIDRALDIIFNHPNVGPFIGRQLIQRFVTSHPTPEYVARVATAFNAGSYTLPTGEQVGDGNRGALDAPIAAILFDEEARDEARADDTTFGKLREPVLRFTHWARAFEVNSADAANELALKNTGGSEALGQHPYGANSVFNFYRPGYIAPGTATGDLELTAPELQIENAGTVIGYPNFLTVYALGLAPQFDNNLPQAYLASYATEAALADNPDALLDHLDLLLTHGRLEDDTRQIIAAALAEIPSDTEELLRIRAQLASVMVMTAPEYKVLR
ncbi:MAG: DUF1800 domain-containing protein [Halioglobus sp.]|nr:DUF1800 domain-containing protein [Halioglobus sp.]